jgi:hypothetical protein
MSCKIALFKNWSRSVFVGAGSGIGGYFPGTILWHLLKIK